MVIEDRTCTFLQYEQPRRIKPIHIIGFCLKSEDFPVTKEANDPVEEIACDKDRVYNHDKGIDSIESISKERYGLVNISHALQP